MTRIPLILALLACSSGAAADWNWCSATRSISTEMDTRGVTRIEIRAVSGDLSVRGQAAAGPARVDGRACTPRKYRSRIDEIRIIEERDGGTLRIIAEVPRNATGTSLVGSLDLKIGIPDNVPVDVFDTSGDMEISQTASLSLQDSSGDIWLKDINGDVDIDRDSSGDIEIRNVGHIRIGIDSSGDLDVREAQSLHLGKDSSGDITAYDIAGDVYVGSDSSGDIAAIDVLGNVTVERDGSGDIATRRVQGTVTIPRNKRDD